MVNKAISKFPEKAEAFIGDERALIGPESQETAIVAAGMQAILESGDFVTSAQISALANFSTKDPSAQPSKWKCEGEIFAVTYQNVNYFPLYGLDPSEGHKPLRRLRDILVVLSGKKDAWGIALWFLAANSYLDGQRPQDILRDAPDAVLAAANEEVGEVLHG